MLDRFHYGVCYYPEHWHPSRHASDIARINDAGFDFIRIGEGAWNYWEPREGEFQFDLFDNVIDLCRKHKLTVVMGTPTYAAPAWVPSKYPEVLRWNFERVPMAHGSRRNLTYSSKKYLDLSDKLCTALAEHYKSEKQIVAWQLDNEFNCHMDVSYAPADTLAWREWLKAKYKTLDTLNDAWGTKFWALTYDAWEQIDLPHPTPTVMNPSVLLDEVRFISDTVVTFASRQAAILRRFNSKWRITHNGLFGNIDGPKLVQQLDFFSHDQYPLFWDGKWAEFAGNLIQARSLSFPYGVLEQQAGPGGQMAYLQRTPLPGEMRLWAWQSVAHGANLLSYFRWRTCPYGSEQHWHGLIDSDDRDTRRLAEAKQTGEEFRRLPPAFLKAAPVKVVALLRDFDSDTNDRRINTYTKAGQWEIGRWQRELQVRHVPVDQVWSSAPEESWTGYKLLIAPHLTIVTPELAEKLESFSRAGGTLVLGAQAGTFDKNCHLIESPAPGLLRKLAGVEVDDWSTVAEGRSFTARLQDGKTFALDTFVERVRPTGKKTCTLATFCDEPNPLLGSSPAVTYQPFAKGGVYYVAGFLPQASVGTLLSQLMTDLSIAPAASASDDVEILVRAQGKQRFCCLLNHSPCEQPVRQLPAGQDLLTGEPTTADVFVPPFGVRIIEAR